MSEQDLEPLERRRKRLVGLALIAALLIAIPVVSVVLRPDSVDAPESDSRRPTAPPNPAADVFAVDFVDERHAFALRTSSCDDHGCRYQLLVTHDGERWRERRLPADAYQADRPPALSALGPCSVAIDPVGHDSGADVRLFSGDCGRSWRPVSRQVVGDVASIPPGAIIGSGCDGGPEAAADCDANIVVNMPRTGERRRLVNAPALTEAAVERVPFSDGSRWVSGIDPETRRWSVATSADDGRTWWLRALPRSKADGEIERIHVAGQGENTYAIAKGGPEHRDALVAIFHSADNGKTWRQTWRTGGKQEPARLAGAPLARPDDLLIIDSSGRHDAHSWRSFDHGRTFSPSHSAGLTGTATRTRAGYVLNSNLGTRWFRSPDGKRWEEMTFLPTP